MRLPAEEFYATLSTFVRVAEKRAAALEEQRDKAGQR